MSTDQRGWKALLGAWMVSRVPPRLIRQVAFQAGKRPRIGGPGNEPNSGGGREAGETDPFWPSRRRG